VTEDRWEWRSRKKRTTRASAASSQWADRVGNEPAFFSHRHGATPNVAGQRQWEQSISTVGSRPIHPSKTPHPTPETLAPLSLYPAPPPHSTPHAAAAAPKTTQPRPDPAPSRRARSPDRACIHPCAPLRRPCLAASRHRRMSTTTHGPHLEMPPKLIHPVADAGRRIPSSYHTGATNQPTNVSNLPSSTLSLHPHLKRIESSPPINPSCNGNDFYSANKTNLFSLIFLSYLICKGFECKLHSSGSRGACIPRYFHAWPALDARGLLLIRFGYASMDTTFLFFFTTNALGCILVLDFLEIACFSSYCSLCLSTQINVACALL
jgi:hypothetical protein